MASEHFVGEYTGTAALVGTHQILVLSSLVQVNNDGADVVVNVSLSNGCNVILEVPPSVTLLTLKTLLHHHYHCPPPHAFELFCARRRQPLPASTSPSLPTPDNPALSSTTGCASSLAPSATHHFTLTVAEALRLVPPDNYRGSDTEKTTSFSPPGDKANDIERLKKQCEREELRVLLVAAAPLKLGTDKAVLVTTFDMLDAAHPKMSETKRTNMDAASASASPASATTTPAGSKTRSSSENRTKQVPTPTAVASTSAAVPTTVATAVVAGPGPRPSRPAAHPKERTSKARKTFAGLRRGFFTPNKKKKQHQGSSLSSSPRRCCGRAPEPSSPLPYRATESSFTSPPSSPLPPPPSFSHASPPTRKEAAGASLFCEGFESPLPTTTQRRRRQVGAAQGEVGAAEVDTAHMESCVAASSSSLASTLPSSSCNAIFTSSPKPTGRILVPPTPPSPATPVRATPASSPPGVSPTTQEAVEVGVAAKLRRRANALERLSKVATTARTTTKEEEEDGKVCAYETEENAGQRSQDNDKNVACVVGSAVPPPRCDACRKKLKLVDLVSGGCRCGGRYCSRHAHFTAHECRFDFMGWERRRLLETSPGSLAPTKVALI